MNLEELKQRRMEELQAQDGMIQEQLALQQQIGQLENMVKTVLSREALERYGNLKAAYPEKSVQVLLIISQLIQTGQINDVIDDQTFVSLLRHIQGPKKEFRITRK